MEQDKYKNWIDDGDVPLTRSSQINATRSQSIKRRVNQDEYDVVIFDQPTYRQRRSAEPVIEEYERRNRQLPHTRDDDRIDTRRPRYPLPQPRPRLPEPGQQKKISRRVFGGILTVGIAAVAGGVQVAKYNNDQAHAAQRMKLGQYSFIKDSIKRAGQDKPTRLYAWIESDYVIHLYQANPDGKSDEQISLPITDEYNGPLDQVVLSFELHPKIVVVRMDAGSATIRTAFTDNGSFFVGSGE